MRTALLVGASGLVGSHCLNILLAHEAYATVRVFVRKPLGISHPKLEEYIVNFDHLANCTQVMNVNDVFCTLGTTIRVAGSQEAFYNVDCTYPTVLAELSSRHGAEQFLIVTALGANPHSSVFYNRVKGEVEQNIQTQDFQSITILRPSLLLGERKETRLGERIAVWMSPLLNALMVGSLKKYRAIEARTVAAGLVYSALNNAERHIHGIRILESDAIEALPTAALRSQAHPKA